MAAIIRMCCAALCLLAALFMAPPPAPALPQILNEVKPEPPPKSRQIVMIVIDGLQAESVSAGRTPNINGLGMAGIRADRVSTMPPDNTAARLYTLLSGTDPSDHKFDGENPAPGYKSILSRMEEKGIKTALVDGTGYMEKSGSEVSFKKSGPFQGDGEILNGAIEVIRSKKPFLTVAVLTGPGAHQRGADETRYNSSVTSADNEVGKFLRMLQTDGVYDSTMLVVAGTTGRPPLIAKGSDFLAGSRLPPVCLKDLAPTIGYLYGINMAEAKGLVLWNALRPAEGRTEIYVLAQRVRELSAAYADAVDAAARLENEKILVQEEKFRLARDKQKVEKEIEIREGQIEELNTAISVMKLAGLLGLAIFAAAMVVQYKILKKRYLFFT